MNQLSYERKMSLGDFVGVAMLLVIFSFPLLSALRPTNYGIVLTSAMFSVSLLYVFATAVTQRMVLVVCLIAFSVLVCSLVFAGSLIGGVEDLLKFVFFYVVCVRRDDLFAGQGLKRVSLILLATILVANLGLAATGVLYSSSGSEFKGTFGSVNLTSYFLVFSAFYLALWVERRSRIASVLLLLATITAMICLTETRSIVFLLPFLVCYVFNWDAPTASIKFVVPMVALGAASIGYVLVNAELLAAIASAFEDDSYSTRLEIYTRIFSEIRARLGLIPGGVGWSERVMAMEFNGYPVHNDFLKYILDYGAFFYFIFCVTLLRVCFFTGSMQKTLLGLFYLSAALHNNLYSPFLIVPYILCQQYLREKPWGKRDRSCHINLQRREAHSSVY